MKSAVVAKVLAKRAKEVVQHKPFCYGQTVDICRFLPTRNERKFIMAFSTGLESGVMDIQYYLTLWRTTNSLKRVDCRSMRCVLGTEIDLRNILWIYRLKKYYQVFGDAIYGFLIPVNHRLSVDILAKMIACKDVAELQSVLSNTIYSTVFGNFDNPEQHLVQAVQRRYMTEGRYSHIALICGYLFTHTTKTQTS